MLRIAFRLACAGLAFSFSAPVLAAAIAAQDAENQKAVELSRLIHPVDLAVSTATEGMDRYFVAALLKQPEMAEMEAQYPGIIKAMYAAGRPFMIEAERRNAVKIQEALAGLYAAEFSAAELDSVIRFYSSPTGRKIVRGMFNPAVLSNTMDAVARDPEADLSAETLMVNQAQAVGHMAATLTAEDESAAAAFLATDAGAKVKAMTPKVQEMALKIANAEQPDLQVKVNAAMQAVAEQYFAKGPKN